MKDTKIAWTDATWNPVTGCTKVSPGCDHCYAEAVAERFRGGKAFPHGFDVTLHPDRLDAPRHWRKPKRIFVNSMSDLFHKDIPDEFLVDVWATMYDTPRHTYQILTKRPHRMEHKIKTLGLTLQPNIWLGTSVENQTMADSRIPPLLNIFWPQGVSKRFISAEPLLGPISLWWWLPTNGRAYGCHPPISWCIVGGESGRGRRPMDLDWARSLRDQCQEAGAAFFFKQGNALRPGEDRELDGRTWDEFPQ